MSHAYGTARLHAYVALAAFGLVAALATGRPELAALAAPFAVALVVGIAATVPPRVAVAVELDTGSVVQGEQVAVTLTLTAVTDTQPVEVMLELPSGVDLLEPRLGAAWSVALRGGVPRVVTATVVARAWGRHDLGRVATRVRPRFRRSRSAT